MTITKVLVAVAAFCFVIAVMIASVLTCKCRRWCPASLADPDLEKLKPHVKKLASDTLITLFLGLVLDIVGTFNSWKSGRHLIYAFASVLHSWALVYSGYFAWGRGREAIATSNQICCCPCGWNSESDRNDILPIHGLGYIFFKILPLGCGNSDILVAATGLGAVWFFAVVIGVNPN